MLNYIWAIMILLGLFIAAISGNLEQVSNNLLDSTNEAVDLLIVMFGVICMWNGFLSIAEGSGLTKSLSKKMYPFIHYLFPHIPAKHPAISYICANFMANILGLGWACTPTGICAMKSLQKLETERGHSNNYASNEMCTFLILNISSLQILPINMIVYRRQYGSPTPLSIIAPALLATTLTTLFAIIICKLICTRKEVI